MDDKISLMGQRVIKVVTEDGGVMGTEASMTHPACRSPSCCPAHFLRGQRTSTGLWTRGWGPLLDIYSFVPHNNSMVSTIVISIFIKGKP